MYLPNQSLKAYSEYEIKPQYLSLRKEVQAPVESKLRLLLKHTKYRYAIAIRSLLKHRFIRYLWFNVSNIALSVATIAYGVGVASHPEILHYYQLGGYFNWLITNNIIGPAAMVVGTIKFLGILMNHKGVRKLGIVLLVSLWSMISIAFITANPPSTLPILGITFAILLLNNSAKGDFR